MGYKQIVFDVDGTLIDTEYAVIHSLQDTIRAINGKIISDKELTFALGITGENALQRLGVSDIASALVSNHQFNWWFIISPPKGYCYYSPQRAVSQALLLARYKAVLLESSRLDSSACSFIYF